MQSCSNTLIKQAINTYNTKYGTDSFKRALIDTQGYFNTLEALDNIDRCNRIRASKTELAKFYTDVLGEPVPDNVQQLRISPYLMKISAVNVTLNCAGRINHIYGACPNYGNTGITGTKDSGGSQNVTGGKFGDNTKIVNLFEAWWDIENHNKTVSHNKAIAKANYSFTGFAISNPSKLTEYAVAGQDFIEPATTGYTSYKTVKGKTYYSNWRNVTVRTTKKGTRTYKY